MTNRRCILALDQGTSSTKGVLFGLDAGVLGVVSVPVDLESPQSGWVQQDPEVIYQSVLQAAGQLLASNPDSQVLGVALTNQRESALAWDPQTGKPLSAMLGWQDRRTSDRIDSFTEEQLAQIRRVTGLPLDPMFSALKFAWILDQIDPSRKLAEAGQIALGTVDSWLVYRLTGQHVIEAGNASRTQLLDLQTGDWSAELLDLFDIPVLALPKVVTSDSRWDITTEGPLAGLPILSVLADSHAALFAHQASTGSTVKATFGTGSSVMALSDVVAGSDSGLVATAAWSIGGDLIAAVEGNILSSGSTAVWLGQWLQRTPAELAELAQQRQPAGISSGQVNLVPAFGGLGAPWWDVDARALIDGMSLATDAADLAVAAFEAICLQIEDVVLAVERTTGQSLTRVSVDGGPTSNPWLMQLMADLSQRTIAVSPVAELSAVGAALLAVDAAGLEQSLELGSVVNYLPKVSAAQAADRKSRWDAAVATSRRQGQSLSKTSNNK